MPGELVRCPLEALPHHFETCFEDRGHSDRSASMTLMRAARAAGSADATTAAASRTTAEATTGAALGIRMSWK